MVRRITDKQKISVLQEMVKVKDSLFGDGSEESKIEEWKRIADFAKKNLKIQGRDYKFFKNSFWYNCKSGLGVSRRIYL
jgi:hypothetical protein